MPEYERKHLPNAVYLDTNILRSAGPNFNKPCMSELRSFTREYGVHLCITELVLEEWCQYILGLLRTQRQKLLSAMEFLKEYEIKVPDSNESLLILPDCDKLKEIIRERFQNSGFEIIENWAGSVSELIIEAVQKFPPFEEGGKGFCDAVIVESYILHASQQFDNPRIMVITNDEAMRHSQERFFRKGINVTIAREDEIVEKLKALLDNEVASFIKERENRLFQFVKKYEQEILAFISKSPLRFTDWWLQPIFSKEDKIQGLIQSVLSAKPIQITKVVGGAPLSREKVPSDRYPVDIWVEMELEVVVLESDFLSSLLQPRGIAEPERIGEASPLTLKCPTFSPPREKRITINRNVYVEATVNAKGAERGEYDNLKVERIH
jgi:hypothetical protein